MAMHFKFQARQTSVHSFLTLFRPRSKNWRKPITDLMMPNIGSTVCLRNACASLPVAGRYHRASTDSEMTASLLPHREAELRARYKLREVSHELLRKIQKVPKSQLDQCLERHRNDLAADR